MNKVFRYDTTAWGVVQLRRADTQAPINADGTVTAKIIGEDGVQIGATITMTAFGGFTGAYKWSKLVTGPEFIPGRVYQVKIECVVLTVSRIEDDTFQVT